MNTDAEKLLTKVREFYETSRDFNGLPISSLDIKDSELNEIIIELIRAEDIDLVRGWPDGHPNPHIKALPPEPINIQIRKIKDKGLGTGCLYPTPNHLKRFGTRHTKDAPFTFKLEIGAPQLEFQTFDIRILEWYRNDPRYNYYSNDVHGRICRRPNSQVANSQIVQDKLDNFEFGFAYSAQRERAVVVHLRDLHKLQPELQRYLANHQLKGYYELHPDYYRTEIIGDFPEGISIYDAFLKEKKIINEMCEKIGYQHLFRTNDTATINYAGFGILIRPTKKEFQDFALLLDKLLTDDLNREFFKNTIPVLEVSTQEDGSKKEYSIGTITLLENWLKKYFLPQDPNEIESLFKNLRAVRKARQRPAHVADENQFNPGYIDQQVELISKGYHAVEAIRMILENHPRIQEYNNPDWQSNTKVWIK